MTFVLLLERRSILIQRVTRHRIDAQDVAAAATAGSQTGESSSKLRHGCKCEALCGVAAAETVEGHQHERRRRIAAKDIAARGNRRASQLVAERSRATTTCCGRLTL